MPTLFQKLSADRSHCLHPCEDIVCFSLNLVSRKLPMLCGMFALGVVTHGEAVVSINYSDVSLHKGDCFFMTPHMVVSLVSTSDDFESSSAGFQPSFFDNLSSHATAFNQLTSFLNENSVPALGLSQERCLRLRNMISLFSAISDAILHRNGLRISISNLLWLQLSEFLHEAAPSPEGKVSHSVELYRSFRKLLTENFRARHCIAFYAETLCISPAYLSRIVRRHSGESVNRQLARILMCESRRLLDCTDLSIKEIAESLGFSSQAAFGKFFKDNFGSAPSFYRAANQP